MARRRTSIWAERTKPGLSGFLVSKRDMDSDSESVELNRRRAPMSSGRSKAVFITVEAVAGYEDRQFRRLGVSGLETLGSGLGQDAEIGPTG